MTACRICDLLG